jgi:CubicO group peptidase (beta-lactamase class C family)
MVADPGPRFQYDSGGVILLSAILKKQTGMHADRYAQKTLFAKLGIRTFRWQRNAEGHPHTGGGLFLRPMDMAKLGLLYLRGGTWGGEQVVPASWVRESTFMHVPFGVSENPELGYGYLWWILKPYPGDPSRTNIYAACGFMGQFIFVVPGEDLVPVFTGSSKESPTMDLPKEILDTTVLPAVLR